MKLTHFTKKHKTLIKSVFIFAALVISSYSLRAQTTIASYDFESGFQGWTDGGDHAGRYSSSSWACNGSRSIYSRGSDTDENYMTSPTLDLTGYTYIDISFCHKSTSVDNNEGFNLQYYDGTSWTVVRTWTRTADWDDQGSSNPNSFSETLDFASYTFNASSRFRFSGISSSNGEWNFFDDVLIEGTIVTGPEIDVQGNSVSIVNNDLSPAVSDHTDFESVNVNESLIRTFTIYNTGVDPLTITSISLSNTTDFSITGTAYASPVASGGSTTFQVLFNSSTAGLKSSTVTIANDDSDESSYVFGIQATAEQNFFDSDGDGILDNVDIDDDNDGIADSVEELACKNSNISVTTNYKFLNESFGTGNRTTINTTYNAVTTYCYEDGTASCPSLGGDDLNDGEYTVYYRAADGDGIDDTPIEEVGSWADAYWYTGEDHTTGDTNGRMAMFNAAIDPGLFYTASIKGALPDVPITYSFWVLNLDTVDAPGIATRLRPDILVEFRDSANNLLASITTGDIPPSINGDAAGSWYNFSADLTFSVSEFNVYFYNNQLGGLGNDLAIDDIEITQTLCDTDSDGIADVFDLDSDNDGIPDVVESGFATTSNGKAIIDSWVDSNGNGMHDAAESATPLDSDGDGTPNFLDLDSDNDSIFDVDESGAGNSGDSSFENGDGDIDGDGVGDGDDTDAVREKDFNSDGTSEYFTDGILDIYDYFNGSTMATAYGNQNQGTGHTYFVLDSDNDGTPDYIDTYNDSTGNYDISQTLYASLDGNNDGVIDDTTDSEGDGLVDLFDTSDTEFGSPRDLSMKLQLCFDGRNDYVQDASITSGWSDISLMGWIKIDPAGSGDRFLFGQDNFYLRILANGRLYVVASGTAINYSVVLPTDQWVHVGATYSSTTEALQVYVNGEQVRDISKTGVLDSDTSQFTMGKRPTSNTWFFKGFIDEVRLFDKALTEDEFQKIVYQEIEDNGSVRGTEIPRDVSSVAWANLEKYYRLDSFKGDITDDLSTTAIDEGTGAKMYNIKDITYQSAPMPFVTQSGNTTLPLAVGNSDDGIRGEDAVDYDWSIVRIEHNDVTYDGTQKHLGLIINEEDSSNNPIEYHVTNDSQLAVSWYLKLDGFIDLEGESQLIQGSDSQLDPSSAGKLERDQQGTADTYTYNYWSSPVSIVNSSSNNTTYTLPDVLRDGSNAASPLAINFVNGYDGADGTPISLAHYWIWKFSNLTTDDYSSWQHVRHTGSLTPGEGFTMKGPGTGAILDEQNYVFTGKPNNGDISLTINSGNSYLVGNPYPSALDANEFINDNPDISGTLSFWEHWGGGSHVLNEYQGGYALYNLSGGVAAPAPDPDVAQIGVGTKTPGRYIPVSQGFFVNGTSDGSIVFENDQRVFAKESGSSSVFMRTTSTDNTSGDDSIEDERMKIRLGFKSSNTLQLSRQILLTIDDNATPDIDWGYDGESNDEISDDMFWIINNEKYIIQGSNEANSTSVFPLGIKTSTDGMGTIRIDSLAYVPQDLNIYVHDSDLNLYHDLRAEDYEVTLNTGEYLNRFEIVFDTPETLSNPDLVVEDLKMYYSTNRRKIVVLNPKLIELEQLQLININGQIVYDNKNLWQETYAEYAPQALSTGVYIINLKSTTGVLSKKILIQSK